MGNRKWKRMSMVFIVLLIAASLSACSKAKNESVNSSAAESANNTASQNAGASANSDAKADAEADAVPKGVEITYSQWITGSQGELQKKVYEEIIAEYERKSGNKVKYELLPDKEYRTWMTTQGAANALPEVMQTKIAWGWEDHNKGLVLDLEPYLNKANPYMPGKPWKDTISPSLMEQSVNPVDGTAPSIPINTVVVRIFYNKDLFEKAGITQLPSTWNEFLDAQRKLKEIGVVPFAFANSKPADNAMLWFTSSITGQLDEHLLADMDFDKSGLVTKNELVAAVDDGIVDMTKSPYKDAYEIIKNWSQYWNKDYNSTDSKAALQMWLRGDAAMTILGSWDLISVDQVEGRTFKFGVMQIPVITKEMNTNAKEKSVVLGGKASASLAISADAKGDKLKVAADFVQYLMSPEVNIKLGNEMYNIPSLVGISMSEQLDGFQLKNEDVVKTDYYSPSAFKEFNEFYLKSTQLYLNGDVDLTRFADEVNKELKKAVDNAKKTNGWSKENNYGAKK